MIEALIDGLHGDFFPTTSVVARLATLHKASVMRIRMAISALLKRDTSVPRLIVRAGRMTFLTSDLNMQASQRITGPGVIKLADVNRLPVLVAVTLQAILA